MLGSLLGKLLEATLLVFDSSIDSGSASKEQAVFGTDSTQLAHNYPPWKLSQSWGQYSPWFSAPSEIAPAIPASCRVTFAQVLSRHGSRFPTSDKAETYRQLVNDIQDNVNRYGKGYEFIKTYKYTMGADTLTQSGRIELFRSGERFYNRYAELAASNTPFVRTGDIGRVVESADNWIKGFHQAKTGSHHIFDPDYPYPKVIIGEAAGFNNTLCHGSCDAFEKARINGTGRTAKLRWASIFVPPIQERINKNLPGADLGPQDILALMDLCPFDTVASSDGTLSPFCSIFTENEWKQYNYLQTLGQYYGYGDGNRLGPTQGVGFVNELIARLTRTPVEDQTSTNRTLDSDPHTFPLDRKLYADFSHDNSMTSMYSALALYRGMPPLSNTTMQSIHDTNGYSAAYTVPFAARMYVEKMICEDSPDKEMVRVLVNDRVMPLEMCGADKLGRCSLDVFIFSLNFAQNGGKWDEC